MVGQIQDVIDQITGSRDFKVRNGSIEDHKATFFTVKVNQVISSRILFKFMRFSQDTDNLK